jgi:biofilm PGA synthesis protein PgaD
MFWALWLYLWLPLLALLAWALGLQQAYKYMVVLGGYQEVLRLLMLYALVILLLGGTLVFWAIYNIVRFHGVENRRVNLAITPAEIARDFDMEQAAVERWQSAHTLQVTHDENGRITDAEISKKPAISR